ncbi:hypothetical protein Aduo_009249 [Ancylostoma duodenale]
MDLKEIVLYFVVVCSSLAEAIRCKCTKESETVSCVDGVCEMEPGCEFFLDPSLIVQSELILGYRCPLQQFKSCAFVYLKTLLLDIHFVFSRPPSSLLRA